MRKVLIVDDDTIIRITLRSLINWEEMGFQIVADAIHGEAALAYLKDHTVDLIISDMKMPVLDGIGLLEAVSRFWCSADTMTSSWFGMPSGLAPAIICSRPT